MKKTIYIPIVLLLVISTLLIINKTHKNEIKKPLTAAQAQAKLKQWQATPDGINYTNWEASPQGKKVSYGIAKISNDVKKYNNMQAVVTSLSLPQGARLGFGFMVKINNTHYILSFGVENAGNKMPNSNESFEQLRNLKPYDTITIKSHTILKAPKYSYPIIAADYVEQNGKIIYKRAPRKNGC